MNNPNQICELVHELVFILEKQLFLLIPVCVLYPIDLDDDMGIKQVCTEVLVYGHTISKYSLVGRTVDSDAARKSLVYH